MLDANPILCRCSVDSSSVEYIFLQGIKQVLVKLGAKGSALFVEGEDPIKQPAISAARVIDTTGAGDTFTAAFAVALVEGKPRKECLKFAGMPGHLFPYLFLGDATYPFVCHNSLP